LILCATPFEMNALMQSGATIYVAGVAASHADGIRLALDAMASGKARARVEEFVKFTRSCA